MTVGQRLAGAGGQTAWAGSDGDFVAKLGEAGDELVFVAVGVLAAGVEVLAELGVGTLRASTV